MLTNSERSNYQQIQDPCMPNQSVYAFNADSSYPHRFTKFWQWIMRQLWSPFDYHNQSSGKRDLEKASFPANPSPPVK